MFFQNTINKYNIPNLFIVNMNTKKECVSDE